MARIVNTCHHLESKLNYGYLNLCIYACTCIYLLCVYMYILYLWLEYIYLCIYDWIHIFLWEVKEKYSIR